MADQPPIMTRRQAIAQLTAAGAPFELAPMTIKNVPCRVFVNAPRSLRGLYADNISDAEFVVYDNERYTFAQIYSLACRLATQLVNVYGVKKGDRVAISMRNYPEWIIGFSAATSIGAVVVAMNAWWEAHEIEEGLKDCGAKVMLADQERLDRVAQIDNVSAQIIAVRPTRADHPGTEFNTLLEGVPENAPMPAVDVLPDDNATIFYTSGSSGFPKGALASHRNILTALMSWELDQQSALLISGVEAPQPVHQPAVLLAVPLFHVTGSHAVYLLSYRAQRKIVTMYKWDAEIAAGLIEAEKIAGFVGPSAMTGDMVQAARRSDRDLSTLMSVGGGGAARAPEQVKAIADAFTAAMPSTGWGMTESNGIGTGIAGQDYLNRPSSSGRASAVVDIKTVDEQGNEVPQGARGELLIRGTTVIQEYWQRPQANAETFTDGWLHTGDVAYFDEEGFVFIVDRIKDLIIRGGENIGCGEVEAALLEYPQVLEASVYAIPDERLGEEVGATVFAEQRIDIAALKAFLGERLAKFKIPRFIQISNESLPRIASGKIFKRKLRDDAIVSLQGKQSNA